MYDRRARENRQITGNIVIFRSRTREYEFATRCVGNARHSIYAVDFMCPSEWKSLSSYLAAHAREGESRLKKIRVHIYPRRLSDLASRDEYIKYIHKQRAAGVDVYFLRADFASGGLSLCVRQTGSVTREAAMGRYDRSQRDKPLASDMEVFSGFVIIDNEAVFVSEEREKRDECGRVYFTRTSVREYSAKFSRLRPEVCHQTLRNERFLNEVPGRPLHIEQLTNYIYSCNYTLRFISHEHGP
jgi:hypothetical protein